MVCFSLGGGYFVFLLLIFAFVFGFRFVFGFFLWCEGMGMGVGMRDCASFVRARATAYSNAIGVEFMEAWQL